jgi:phospholipid transport system substrate-binding protein
MVTTLARAASAALVLSALMAMAPSTAPAQDAPATPQEAAPIPPQQVIENFDQALLGVMKDAKRLGYDGRYKALEPIVDRTFNVPLMTRIVVGAAWNDWTDDQRDQVQKGFGKLILSTYARRFDGYSGESFVVDGTRDVAGGVLVMSRIVRPKDPAVTLNYLMRDADDGQPKIIDVFLTGTISELATRRSEFADILARSGYQGLLASLEQKSANQDAK